MGSQYHTYIYTKGAEFLLMLEWHFLEVGVLAPEMRKIHVWPTVSIFLSGYSLLCAGWEASMAANAPPFH